MSYAAKNSRPSERISTAGPYSVIVIAIASATAHAQNAPPSPPKAEDDTKLESVVITARKRTEAIDTVPLAVTAMPSAKIEARNLKSIEDVASFTPGFFTQSQTGTGAGRNDRSFRQLTFRGIGASSTNVGPLAGGVGRTCTGIASWLHCRTRACAARTPVSQRSSPVREAEKLEIYDDLHLHIDSVMSSGVGSRSVGARCVPGGFNAQEAPDSFAHPTR